MGLVRALGWLLCFPVLFFDFHTTCSAVLGGSGREGGTRKGREKRKEKKREERIQFLGHTNPILIAQQPHVANRGCTGLHRKHFSITA